jgi:predicted helicase
MFPKDNIKISYLWKDIPEYLLFDYGFIKSYDDHRLQRKTNNINKLEDIGSDIIYINHNDECIIVQCKNYALRKSIKIEDLSGFFFIMCKHNDKIGEIYYTNKLSKKILNEYEDNDRIKLIKKEFIQDNKVIDIISGADPITNARPTTTNITIKNCNILGNSTTSATLALTTSLLKRKTLTKQDLYIFV